jgi:hypothetical protein
MQLQLLFRSIYLPKSHTAQENLDISSPDALLFECFLSNNNGESKLVNKDNFYPSFIQDLRSSKREVIVESPLITSARMEFFYPVFEELIARELNIQLITRNLVGCLDGTLFEHILLRINNSILLHVQLYIIIMI